MVLRSQRQIHSRFVLSTATEALPKATATRVNAMHITLARDREGILMLLQVGFLRRPKTRSATGPAYKLHDGTGRGLACVDATIRSAIQVDESEGR